MNFLTGLLRQKTCVVYKEFHLNLRGIKKTHKKKKNTMEKNVFPLQDLYILNNKHIQYVNIASACDIMKSKLIPLGLKTIYSLCN